MSLDTKVFGSAGFKARPWAIDFARDFNPSGTEYLIEHLADGWLVQSVTHHVLPTGAACAAIILRKGEEERLVFQSDQSPDNP